MNRAKILPLLLAALAAAAFAVPATASAISWTKNQEAIEENHTITANGYLSFNFGATGGYTCESEMEIELVVGTDGGILTGFDLGPLCAVSGGFSGCAIELTAADIPSPVRATETREIEIYDFAYSLDLTGSSCWENYKQKDWNYWDTKFILDPDSSDAMSAVSLSGTSKLNSTGETSGFGGNFDISPPGVFGIGLEP